MMKSHSVRCGSRLSHSGFLVLQSYFSTVHDDRSRCACLFCLLRCGRSVVRASHPCVADTWIKVLRIRFILLCASALVEPTAEE